MAQAQVAAIAAEAAYTGMSNARHGLEGVKVRAKKMNTVDLKNIGYIVMAVLAVIVLLYWYGESMVFRQPVTPWRGIPYTSNYIKMLDPTTGRNYLA